MKIQTSAASLHTAVKTAAGVLPNGSGSGDAVFISVDDDGCVLRAVGDEAAVTLGCPVTSQEPGAVVMPSGLLLSLLASIRGGDVTLKGDGAMSWSGGSCKITPHAQPEEFPEEAKDPGGSGLSCKIKAGALRRLIGSVQWAVSREDTRYAMNGVLLDLKGGDLTAVATDGRRLSVGSEPVSDAADGKALLPLSSARMACSLSPDDDAEVCLSADENACSLEVDGARLVSRLIDGVFPPWREVVKVKPVAVVTACPSEMSTALRQAKTLADPVSLAVALKFDGGEMTVSARTADRGAADALVSYELAQGKDPDPQHFNPAYVLDGLKVAEAAGAERVTLAIGGGGKQTVMTAGGVGWRYVLMPITPNGA